MKDLTRRIYNGNGKIHDGDIEDLATIGFKQNTWQVSVAYLF